MEIHLDRAHVENVDRELREGEGHWGLSDGDYVRNDVFRQRQSSKVHHEYPVSATYCKYPETESKSKLNSAG